MTQESKNLYEGMYVISARLSDDARNKALEKIKNGVTSRDGEVHKVHDMGRKRLAYDIEGHREGHYYVIYFSVKPSEISEMWQDYHLSEDLLRFITLRTDDVLEEIKFKSLSEQN